MGIDSTPQLVISRSVRESGYDQAVFRIPIGWIKDIGDSYGHARWRVEWSSNGCTADLQLQAVLANDQPVNEFRWSLYVNGTLTCGLNTATISNTVIFTNTDPTGYAKWVEVRLRNEYYMRPGVTIREHDRWGFDSLGAEYDWGLYFKEGDPDFTIDVSPHYVQADVDWLICPWDGQHRARLDIDGFTWFAFDDPAGIIPIGSSTVAVSDLVASNPNTVQLDTSPNIGIDFAATGKCKVEIYNCYNAGQPVTFEPDSETVTLDKGAFDPPWTNDYERTVTLSGNKVTAYSNTEFGRITATLQADDVIRLVPSFRWADGSAFDDTITIASYTPPGQPPSIGDGWPTMSFLTDISWSAPASYNRTLRHYTVQTTSWYFSPSNGKTFEPVDNGPAGIALYMTASTLDAAGLDKSAWRYRLPLPTELFPEAVWEWLVVDQQARYDTGIYEFDNGGSTSGWTASGSGTLSVEAGKLKLEGPSGKGMSKAYSYPTVALDTCRYLRIDFTGGGDATLAIGGKQWDFTANGTVLFDLCNPSNATGEDDLETRFGSTAGAWGYGVDSPATISLTFDTADPVTVDSLRLDGSINNQENWFHQGEVVGNVPGYGQTRRGVLHLIDGKIVLDEVIGEVEDAVEGLEEGEYERSLPVAYTFEQVLDAIEARMGMVPDYAGPVSFAPGYKSTGAATDEETEYDFKYADRYFDITRKAYHLIPLVGSDNNNVDYTFRAHFAADYIRFGIGAARTITTRAVLGGTIHGLVNDHAAQSPVANADVLIDDELTNEHETLTDTVGLYLSEQLERGETHTAELVANPLMAGSVGKMYQGRRARICLGGEIGEGHSIDLLLDELRSYGIMVYVVGSKLVIRRTYNSTRTFDAATVVPEVTDARRPSVVLAVNHPRRMFGICYDISGTPYIAWSTDGFITREVVELPLSDLTYVRAKVHPVTGVMLIAGWQSASGKIRACRSLDFGVTTTDLVDVAVGPETGFGLDFTRDALNRWVIVYKNASGNIVPAYSADDGGSWTAS